MSVSIGDVIGTLTLKENFTTVSKDVVTKFEQVSNRIASIGSKVSATLNKSFNIPGGTLGSVAALTAVYYGLAKAIEAVGREVVEGEKVQAQLRAGVESTGRAAGYTAEQLLDMSTALMKVSSFDDEVIAGGEALLLTFNRIRGQQFFSAMTDAMDIATRKGVDLNTAVTMIGKAYSGSIEGLRKAGVVLTDSQSKQIKSLFDTGQEIKAQILLHEALQTAVGGSAAAMRDTMGGAIDALKVRWGNLLQVVGNSNSGPFRVGIEGMISLLDSLVENWGVLESATLSTIGQMIEAIADWSDIFVGHVERMGRVAVWFAKLDPFTSDKNLAPMEGFLDKLRDGRQGLHDAAEGFRIKAEEALEGAGKAANKTAVSFGGLAAETGVVSQQQSKLISTSDDLAESISDLNRLTELYRTGATPEDIDTLEQAQKLTKQYLSDVEQYGERAALALRKLRVEESAARVEAEKAQKVWELIQDTLGKHLEPIEIRFDLHGPNGQDLTQWVTEQLQSIEDVRLSNEQAFLEQREAVQVQLQSQADYFRDSLVSPREQLDNLVRHIDALAAACDEAGQPLLSAAEAEQLRAQAALDFADVVLSQAGSVFAQLEQMFGGFFAYLSRAAQTLQQAQQMQGNVSGLASNLGAGAGTASLLGAIGAYVVIAKAIYDEFKAHNERNKARKYDFGAVVGKFPEIGWSMPGMEGEQRRLSNQIKQLAEAFVVSIGGVLDLFAGLEVRVRRDGKYFEAWVEGEMIGRFHTIEEAVEAAIKGSFKSLSTKISGLSALVREGFEQFQGIDAKLDDRTLEEIQSFLGKLREISELSIGDTAVRIREAINHFNSLKEVLAGMNQSSQAVIDGYRNIADAQQRFIEELTNNLFGIDTGAANSLRNLAGLNQELINLSKSAGADLTSKISALDDKIAGMGTGPKAGPGRRYQTEEDLRIAQEEWDKQIAQLKASREEYVRQLKEIPKALATEQIDLGIFTALEPFIRQSKNSAKYAEMAAKFERMRIEAQFGALKMQLIVLGAWERWADVFNSLLSEALANAGNLVNAGAGGRNRGGSGGSTDRKSLREDLRDEIAGLQAEAKGPLHKVFFDLRQSIKDFIERCKEAKLPADEMAAGVAALTKRFKEDMRARADLAAGIGTDFTRKLQDTVKLFQELRDLGREKTGIPDWLLKIREGQALGNLGTELQTMLDAFNGLVNPMLSITSQADALRQNVLAFAEAAGWSSEQIAAAMQQIRDGAEFQRQQAIGGIMGKLFGYLKGNEKFEQQRQAFELKMIDLDFRLMEAQLRALNAWDAVTEEIFNAAHAAARDLSEAADDIVNSIPEPPAIDIPQIMRDAVQRFREGVSDFITSTQAYFTDESVTALTQQEQEQSARDRYNQLLEQANAGNIDAINQLDAARRELLAEIAESQGGTGTSGYLAEFRNIMAQSAQFLQNAQSLEAQVANAAAEAAMQNANQNAENITTAIYDSAQMLANAIWEAIGVVPMMARGGIITRGAPLVRVHAPEAIVPLARFRELTSRFNLGYNGSSSNDQDMINSISSARRNRSLFSDFHTNPGNMSANMLRTMKDMDDMRRMDYSETREERKKLLQHLQRQKRDNRDLHNTLDRVRASNDRIAKSNQDMNTMERRKALRRK